MAVQQIITVNMRRGMEKVPPYKKAAAGAKYLRAFIKRHLKATDVKISQDVNNEIFSRGMKNPRPSIRVMCSKDDKKIVTVNLIKQS
ncbi:MAG: Ribosomal protein L31e [Candidatus Parvarchaeum acidophilus ARMAN-5]|uniref:Large ribosomal subunit protein eL31 n=1 Tax=Candidatus Parvarchaeum acidophilus ARMAN-5 TaxID=662762 RepID=D6GW42_PARA5|nr:MAG: Ribosomal protein L31e [Candidatus Parvarchaeum acidophilus ARMAN-5]